MDCIFCKIAAGQIPAKLVYTDDLAVAFDDINPQAPTHVLIIPRKHISRTLDLTPDDNALVGHLYQVANKIALQRGIAEGGFRIVTNCNLDAGQSVWHIHLHMLGGRKFGWPPG